MPQGQSIHPRARLLMVLALWQWMAVVLGYLVAHGFLKRLEGSFIQCYRQNASLLTQLSFFVRDFGFWIAGIPLIWLAIVLRPRRVPPDARRREPSYLGGILLAVILTVVFGVGGAHAFWMRFGR